MPKPKPIHATPNDLADLPPESKVLLALTDRMGDALFRTPAIRLLKIGYPHLKFSALTFGPAASAALANNPHIEHIHTETDPQKIDNLASDFAVTLSFRSNNRYRYLQNIEGGSRLCQKRDRQIHKAEEMLRSAQSMFHEPPELTDAHRIIEMFPQQPDHDSVDQALGQIGVSPSSHRVIAMHIGCAAGGLLGAISTVVPFIHHRKVWPLTRYKQLADRITTAEPDTRIILIGSKAEQPMARSFQNISNTFDMIGRLSLMELAALMDQASLFIGHDSGPMHVAAARRTPILAFFGPTNPTRTGPYPQSDRNTLLRSDKIANITIDQACEAALSLLKTDGLLT